MGAYVCRLVAPVSGANLYELILNNAIEFPDRASRYFKPLVGQMGWQAYWPDNEFPPQCRALTDDDFECD